MIVPVLTVENNLLKMIKAEMKRKLLYQSLALLYSVNFIDV